MGKSTFQFLIALLLFVSHLGYAQDTSAKAIQKEEPKLSKDDSLKKAHKESIYHLVQRSWIANQEPSYGSLVPFVPSTRERRVPLRDGEGGNSDFSLLEANLNLSFPLFFGSYRNKRSFWKRNRITFDYNGNFRMSLDTSKPIFPGNNKVGFTWYWNLYNKQNDWIFNHTSEKDRIANVEKYFDFLNFFVRVHHYSNGQAGEFFYTDEEIDRTRNNYEGGDFSTNYFYFEASYGWYNSSPSLHQFSLGYQSDWGTEDGAFAFSQQQIRSYGKKRMRFKYDYRTAKQSNKLQFHLRAEFGYILGNLENFNANLLDIEGNPDSDEYRFNMKGLFELAPDNHRAVGYFVSVYYGRDYMNIRYDDIIFSTQLGVTLTLDKFYMPEIGK